MSYTTRIAPSPTGMMHIGTARTAYFNWLAARSTGGKFILRIDDTDTERNSEESVTVILDSMEWLGLDYDEIYYQSKNSGLYNLYARILIENNKAYELDNGAIALKVPTLPEYFDETIAGKIAITDNDKKAMKPLILLRGEGRGGILGSPTYQFSSAVDDYAVGINWIIRGHDHITNTPKQIAIWKSIKESWDIPKLSHVGLVFHNKKKMSKRDNAASVLWYKDQGYHPEAILSFILRLGWAPSIDDKSMKLITRERALELFLEHGKMKAKEASFEEAKLNNIQANYERILKIPNDQWVSKRKTLTL